MLAEALRSPSTDREATRAASSPPFDALRSKPFILGVVATVALAIAVRFALGEYIREDAYITLRYARHIAEGRGFVFNEGEQVLGTTTPLFALLVAALVRVGAPATTAAVWLGIASDAVAIIVLAALSSRFLRIPAVLLAALSFALLSPIVSWSVSGMETSLYTLLIVSSILAYVGGRARLCGLLGGLLVLTRPDGAILVAVLALHCLVYRRSGLRSSGFAFAAVIAPWLVFATSYFGSPIPQSMLAKLYRNVDDPFVSLRNLIWYFSDLDNRFFLPLGLVFLFGIIRVKRDLGLVLLFAWAAAYTGLFLVSNKFLFPLIPFEWYFVPLLAAFSVGIAAGLDRLASLKWLRGGGDRRLPNALLAIVAVAFTVGYLAVLQRQHSDLQEMVAGRETVYLKLADHMATIGVQDEVVAAYEIGAFAYRYPGPILDLWGLVSPAVARVDSVKIIETNRPAWIMSYADMLPDGVSRADWFNREYKPVYALGTWEGRRTTLFRRFPPPDQAALVAKNSLAGDVELLGVGVTVKPLAERRQAIQVTLTWRTPRLIDRHYTFFIHLRDGNNKLLTQQDGEPQGNEHPTTLWQPGEIVVDRHDLVVAADVVEPDTLLVVGGYETGSVQNLLKWAAPSVAEWPHELRFALKDLIAGLPDERSKQ